jgi:hypothetical protein
LAETRQDIEGHDHSSLAPTITGAAADCNGAVRRAGFGAKLRRQGRA